MRVNLPAMQMKDEERPCSDAAVTTALYWLPKAYTGPPVAISKHIHNIPVNTNCICCTYTNNTMP